MKVLVLTTSYPRHADDVAGVFVRDAVDHLREAGVDAKVVSPASFAHFGLAYGHGIVGNLKRRPWLALALPLFLLSFARAARRAAAGVDLVHAHWLPSALPALATRKPFVLQLWGTDVAVAERIPWAVRWLVRRARLVLAPSTALADAAQALGAREVRVVPSGVRLPEDVGTPADPPHVLYVGRLSEEKGVADFLEATDGLPRVYRRGRAVARRRSGAIGFVEPSALGSYYERAAIAACPSRREGYGVVAREAMSYGRPVVASAVGGPRRRRRRRRHRPARPSAGPGRAAIRARAPARRSGAPRSSRPSGAGEGGTGALVGGFYEATIAVYRAALHSAR